MSLLLEFFWDWPFNLLQLFTLKVGITFYVSELCLVRLSQKSSPRFWKEHLLKGFCNCYGVWSSAFLNFCCIAFKYNLVLFERNLGKRKTDSRSD